MLLKLNDENIDIYNMQLKLGIKPATGFFGPLTLEAVYRFQKEHGLKEDGIVGDITWKAIVDGTFPEPVTQVKTLTEAKIKRLLGVAGVTSFIVDKLLDPDVCGIDNITNEYRLSHLLGQCAHESAEFTEVFENLNYSGTGLKKVFGKYFSNSDDIYQFINEPEKIANRVYCNRLGNGDEYSGDGWNCRGQGYIQLTGRYNQAEFGEWLGVDVFAEPGIIATQYPLETGLFFFEKHHLWDISDSGVSKREVLAVTRKINPKLLGLTERTAYTHQFYTILNK